MRRNSRAPEWPSTSTIKWQNGRAPKGPSTPSGRVPEKAKRRNAVERTSALNSVERRLDCDGAMGAKKREREQKSK